METNAMIIDEKDTVAVVIEEVKAGDAISFRLGGEACRITSADDVPIYHKVAVRDMAKGSPVVKYGEHIGVAGREIRAGEHVHVHNVENHRENLQEVEA